MTTFEDIQKTHVDEKDEKDREDISDYIKRYLAKEGPWPSMQALATAANRYGISTSRQTIHNWVTRKTKPLYTHVEGYIHMLRITQKLERNQDKLSEIKQLLEFYEAIMGMIR